MSNAQESPGTIVHEVRWADALPWWILFRAAGKAFSPTVILLAALGALATWGGWSAADQLGLVGVDAAADAIAADKAGGIALAGPGGAVGADALLPSRRAVPWLTQLVDRLPPVAADVARLVAIPFQPAVTLREMGCALARVGWFILVWSIFGTAITRHVALALVDEDAPGLVGATLYGARKWTAAFNGVLFVLCGIAALSVPGAILGLLMRTGWGLAFAGAVWPLVLGGAVVLAILAVGMVAGWPLMVACVGVERGDSFQGISTAFSYLYQRPLHYAFCGAVALVVALPALAAAGVFADLTGTFAMWAASFGMGHDRTGEVLQGLAATGPTATAWGVRAIGFWTRGLEQLLSSFGWGYFWSIATAAYLVLRRDVDGTELDEVVIEEPGEAAA
ncbi:MAG: hypothetical protein ACKOSQ_05905 [Planctomycetaceae bacterium]